MPARKKILIGFFILLITSQLYGMAFAPKTALGEKRALLKMPGYKTESLLKSKYYYQLSKFLDDRYPYRASFIIAKNWIDYHIFNTSPSSQVYIGKDGWFYLKTGLKDYFKNSCEKKQQAYDLAKKLNAIEKVLESAGKKFFFIVPPDKATIYPEHIGVKRSPNNCGKSFYDFFIEALEEYPLHGFIRLDNILLRAKKDYQLYYKRDSHWNHRASVLASKVILERLSTPLIKPGLPDIKFRTLDRTRELATLFSLSLKEKSDYVFKFKRKNQVKTKRLKPLPNGFSHLQITAEAEPGDTLLPRAVIYRDSFMVLPLSLIQSQFKEIDALWTRNIPMGTSAIDDSALRASKIVILEVVERNLHMIIIREKALVWTLGGGLRYKRAGNKL